jgi:hypothetical protein
MYFNNFNPQETIKIDHGDGVVLFEMLGSFNAGTFNLVDMPTTGGPTMAPNLRRVDVAFLVDPTTQTMSIDLLSPQDDDIKNYTQITFVSQNSYELMFKVQALPPDQQLGIGFAFNISNITPIISTPGGSIM